MTPRNDTPMNQLTTQLAKLHDHYAAQVNIAIDQGCDDLVEELAAEFTEAGLHLLQTAQPPPA